MSCVVHQVQAYLSQCTVSSTLFSRIEHSKLMTVLHEIDLISALKLSDFIFIVLGETQSLLSQTGHLTKTDT